MTSSDAETQAAAYVLKRILTAGRDSLTKREIAQRCKGKGMHADDVESPLALLAAHHYLVPVHGRVCRNRTPEHPLFYPPEHPQNRSRR